MILNRPAAQLPDPRNSSGARFVCWCRITEQKRLDRALRLIAELKKRATDLSFTVIGPDLGLRDAHEALAAELGIQEEVRWVGQRDRSYIEAEAAKATFFLQLSSHEGFSMAVVEAMQLGLVPVVTPVGMIPEYCIDGVNSVIFTDYISTAERLAQLLNQPEELERISRAARAHFAEAKLYTQDVVDAAQALVSMSGKSVPEQASVREVGVGPVRED